MRGPSTLAVLLALALTLPASAPASGSPPACTPDPVFFVAAVYDGAQRDDFQADVDNVEGFLSALRTTYCIPDEQTRVLAFANGYERGGTVYEPASEARLLETLSAFGAEAATVQDPVLFLFLSSHGTVYQARPCEGQDAVRPVGSLSVLARGSGHDGNLHDCELGAALTQEFPAQTRMAVFVDCSFCGGFSDSLTLASGTVQDGSTPTPSGVVAPGRIVVTGCAITTECFGTEDGAILYHYLTQVLADPMEGDGWTAPGFPRFQGLDLPRRTAPQDGRLGVSEWFFAALDRTYRALDPVAVQEQYRIKYGLDSLDDDLVVVS